MATQGNLGAVNLNLTNSKRSVEQQLTIKAKRSPEKQAKLPAANQVDTTQAQKEALQNRDSSSERVRAMIESQKPLEPRSIEEIAELLRKVNLTLDLFEIQTRYMVNLESGDVSIQIVNQRTGEVIRKIPPYDVPKVIEALKYGDSLLTDQKV